MTGQSSYTAPLVSVIMITYNQASFIDEAIRGVVLQRTDFPFELIVADDSSTDDTVARARYWQRKYPEIVKIIVRKCNLGLQSNYLDAYSRCSGKYIAICEGDDHWCSSRKLARQVSYMNQHPGCSVCFHRVVNHYADLGTLSLSNGKQQADMTLVDLAKSNVITNLSVMYRAIPFEDIPSWVGDIPLFDYAMHSLHAARGYIHFMSRPMAVYRQYSRGIWSGDNERRLNMAMQVREKLIDHFSDDCPLAKEYLRAYRAIGLNLIAFYLKSGNDSKARSVADQVSRQHGLLGMKEDADKLINEAFSKVGNSGKCNKGIVSRTITSMRAAISRLIPVPRIP